MMKTRHRPSPQHTSLRDCLDRAMLALQHRKQPWATRSGRGADIAECVRAVNDTLRDNAHRHGVSPVVDPEPLYRFASLVNPGDSPPAVAQAMRKFIDIIRLDPRYLKYIEANHGKRNQRLPGGMATPDIVQLPTLSARLGITLAPRRKYTFARDADEVFAMACVKLKYDAAALQALKATKATTAVISGTAAEYIVTNMRKRGSYAKIRHGLRTSDGAMLALREVRLGNFDQDDPARADLLRKTHYTTPGAHDYELNIMRRIGAALQPQDVIYSEEKVFWTMTLAAGTINDAAETLRRYDQRSMAAYTMMFQTATQLEPLHALALTHCDLTAYNVVVLASGDCAVVDFGLTQALAGKTFRGLIGSVEILGPEAVLQRRAGTTMDAWSLGVIYLHMLRQQPLFGDGLGSETERLQQVTRDQSDYIRWFDALGPDLEKLDLSRLDPSTRWGRLFARAAAHDARTTHFVLTRLLHPLFERRATMTEVRAFMRGDPLHAQMLERGRAELQKLAFKNAEQRAMRALLLARAQRIGLAIR